MTAGDWIAIAGIAVTVFCAFVAWMSATFMRVGKILAEVRQIGSQVRTLTSAFDSQEKAVTGIDKRLAVVESRNHQPPGMSPIPHGV